MTKYRSIFKLSFEEYQALGHNGYKTDSVYQLSKTLNSSEISFNLKQYKTEKPFVKTYSFDNKILSGYNRIIQRGFSIGAYENQILKGIVIAEDREWNNSLWIEFIEVAEPQRCKGTGSGLINELLTKIKNKNFRMIELETQNTNFPAINFYMKNGFQITGLNTMLYNSPENENETALYMSRILKNH